MKDQKIKRLTSIIFVFFSLIVGSTSLYATELPLPIFNMCTNNNPPILPEKWEGGAVLQSFNEEEIAIGQFIYDEAAGGINTTLLLFNGESDPNPINLVEALILNNSASSTGTSLYLITREDNSTQCTLLGDTPSKVPSRDWTGTSGICVGEAGLSSSNFGNNLSWWKTKVTGMTPIGANWFWFNTDRNRYPFRMMFSLPSDDYGLMGYFAFNYMPIFQEVSYTNIPELRDLCEDSGTMPMIPGLVELEDVLELVEPDALSVAERQAYLDEMVPGLRIPVAAPEALKPWPAQVELTTFMTSINYCYAPFPTRVYYDWAFSAAQNSTLYWNQNAVIPPTSACDTIRNNPVTQTAYLYGPHEIPPVNTAETGYIHLDYVTTKPNECHQVLPGVQLPDWKTVDNCVVMAEIDSDSILNSTTRTARILRCPIRPGDINTAQQFWTWYTDDGTPLVFMETNSGTSGTGLNLADYYGWEPSPTIPPGTFTAPTICEGQPKHDVPPGCHNCHFPIN